MGKVQKKNHFTFNNRMYSTLKIRKQKFVPSNTWSHKWLYFSFWYINSHFWLHFRRIRVKRMTGQKIENKSFKKELFNRETLVHWKFFFIYIYSGTPPEFHYDAISILRHMADKSAICRHFYEIFFWQSELYADSEYAVFSVVICIF